MVEFISKIGKVIKLGPATNLYAALKNDVKIQHYEWTKDRKYRLELLSHQFQSLIAGKEKKIKECTVHEVITLLQAQVFTDYKNYASGRIEDKKKDASILVDVDRWDE